MKRKNVLNPPMHNHEISENIPPNTYILPPVLITFTGNIHLMTLFHTLHLLGRKQYRKMTETYLHLAVETGQPMMFKKLIELEENKDKRTGRRLFHYACLYGQKKIANFLMEKASDFNLNLTVSDNDGRTAFHFACLKGHSDIVQTLLEKSNEFNFDLNAKVKMEPRDFFLLVRKVTQN